MVRSAFCHIRDIPALSPLTRDRTFLLLGFAEIPHGDKTLGEEISRGGLHSKALARDCRLMMLAYRKPYYVERE